VGGFANTGGVEDVVENLRLPSPAPRPQALAFDGDKLWMGSIETSRLYAIDPRQWTVLEEAPLPGLPWGMTVVGDELRVICGEGEDDDRWIRRFVPGHGAKTHDAIACPDFTGSQLSFDGARLYVSQWYNKRILGLSEDGQVVRTIEVPRGVCGQVFVDGNFFALTTDDEDGDYFLMRAAADAQTPQWEDVARVPFAARALAYDGTKFWTNHRERNEIIAFTAP
jgi:hypothetical protein